MTGAPQPPREPVRPAVALGLTLVGFLALVIAGLGIVGLITDQDVIATPGLGQLPGIAGIVVTGCAFALSLWLALRGSDPSFWNALWVAVSCFLAYLIGVAAGILIAGADPAVAAGVAGRIATGWFGLVVTLAALVSAWSAIALVRTSARRPRWPWENDEGQ